MIGHLEPLLASRQGKTIKGTGERSVKQQKYLRLAIAYHETSFDVEQTSKEKRRVGQFSVEISQDDLEARTQPLLKSLRLGKCLVYG